jgi:alpha-glucosidase
MYYGEEIGMTNVPISPDQVLDNAEKNEPGLGQGRDPERTPMPWDGSTTGGFTTGWPWLPLGDNHAIVNVATLEQTKGSILHLYRKLIDLRRDREVLLNGVLSEVTAEKNVLRYERVGEEDRLLVLLNMGLEPARVSIETGVVLASTSLNREGERVTAFVDINAAEGLVIEPDL